MLIALLYLKFCYFIKNSVKLIKSDEFYLGNFQEIDFAKQNPLYEGKLSISKVKKNKK